VAAPSACKSHVCELGPTSEPGCRGANCLLSLGSTDTLKKSVSWGLGSRERKSGSLELRDALISPPVTSSYLRAPRRPPRRAILAPAVVARARGTRGHGHDGAAQPRPQQQPVCEALTVHDQNDVSRGTRCPWPECRTHLSPWLGGRARPVSPWPGDRACSASPWPEGRACLAPWLGRIRRQWLHGEETTMAASACVGRGDGASHGCSPGAR